jgi:hypothetical protein
VQRWLEGGTQFPIYFEKYKITESIGLLVKCRRYLCFVLFCVIWIEVEGMVLHWLLVYFYFVYIGFAILQDSTPDLRTMADLEVIVGTYEEFLLGYKLIPSLKDPSKVCLWCLTRKFDLRPSKFNSINILV